MDDDDFYETERKLYNEYISLNEIWENAAKSSKNLDEYDKTKPLFDKSIEAFKKWKNYLFKNGFEKFPKRKDF